MELSEMTPEEAVQKLSKVVGYSSGSSQAAASVLLYAWNPRHPIRDLYKLDEDNHAAAIIVIQSAFYPEIFDGGNKIEEITGHDMSKLAEIYGKDGTEWQE